MLHIFNQADPYPDGWGSASREPSYFSDAVYYYVASLLGVNVQSHPVGYVRNRIHESIWLSATALKRMKMLDDDLAIIWQGYGVYAALANAAFAKTPFILNTYKVPFVGHQTLKAKINDRLLVRAIKAATGVITISSAQADGLRAFNPQVLCVPFASDKDWWTPGSPDHEFLSRHGIACRNYVLIIGDVHRDEVTTLQALRNLNYPILRVTRSPKTALAAKEAFKTLGIKRGRILVNVSFELLREIYRGARAVVVAARSNLSPAGMTSLTEAMSCGRPVLIPAGLTTDGYIVDGYDGFALGEWKEQTIRDRIVRVFESDIGETVGRNARTTVEERLNFPTSARKLADFIAECGITSQSSATARMEKKGG